MLTHTIETPKNLHLHLIHQVKVQCYQVTRLMLSYRGTTKQKKAMKNTNKGTMSLMSLNMDYKSSLIISLLSSTYSMRAFLRLINKRRIRQSQGIQIAT